ncbi:MAG TPA: SRPBCC family protein [Verrucomicrobiae bacterium]|nr:SRPBCC family protein [Verrucomicrobiae bacterium]
MLVKILIVLAVLLVGFIIVVALRPSQFRIMRSALISAPPEVVFPQVNDLHNWEAWSPWAKLDPAAKGTYEGPAAGVGAVFGWSGNQNIGEGRMAITESQLNELVRFRLDFVRPFKGTNVAEFTFKPENGQTRVTWTMSGRYSFIPKAIGLFINCDDMVGKQFEKGLVELNTVAGSTVKA